MKQYANLFKISYVRCVYIYVYICYIYIYISYREREMCVYVEPHGATWGNGPHGAIWGNMGHFVSCLAIWSHVGEIWRNMCSHVI